MSTLSRFRRCCRCRLCSCRRRPPTLTGAGPRTPLAVACRVEAPLPRQPPPPRLLTSSPLAGHRVPYLAPASLAGKAHPSGRRSAHPSHLPPTPPPLPLRAPLWPAACPRAPTPLPCLAPVPLASPSAHLPYRTSPYPGASPAPSPSCAHADLPPRRGAPLPIGCAHACPQTTAAPAAAASQARGAVPASAPSQPPPSLSASAAMRHLPLLFVVPGGRRRAPQWARGATRCRPIPFPRRAGLYRPIVSPHRLLLCSPSWDRERHVARVNTVTCLDTGPSQSTRCQSADPAAARQILPAARNIIWEGRALHSGTIQLWGTVTRASQTSTECELLPVLRSEAICM